MNTVLKNIKNIVLVLLIAIFLILSFKKVYTSDTLIPNLEPYPDTLYYSVPAWNFVHGNGFVMNVGETVIKQQTPPLLGIYLLPFFAAFKDVRSFYFANILLSILSIILFVQIVDKIFRIDSLYKAIFTLFLGFFLVTNFYFYSMPQLLMAEPITLFLVTLGIYLYFSKSSVFNTFLSGQLGFLLILVKLSNVTYALIFAFLFLEKYILNKKNAKFFKLFLISSGIGVLYFSFYLLTSKLLTNHKNLGGSDFSIINLQQGLIMYAKTLIGEHATRYLWYTQKFVPPLISMLVFIGLVMGLLRRNLRNKVIVLSMIILTTIIFTSLFVQQDIRHIVSILPAFILLAGFSIREVEIRLNKKVAIILMIFILFCTLFLKNQGYKEEEYSILTFKKQVGLNLRHREVPWNYEAVMVFNEFTKNFDKKNTYLATFLPSPFIDFYSNNKYMVLPISTWQEFYWLEPKLLKKVVGKDIVARYKKLIEQGNNIYITHYYESNVPSQWPKQINELISNFSVTKVFDGCLSSCDLYQLKNIN